MSKKKTKEQMVGIIAYGILSIIFGILCMQNYHNREAYGQTEEPQTSVVSDSETTSISADVQTDEIDEVRAQEIVQEDLSDTYAQVIPYSLLVKNIDAEKQEVLNCFAVTAEDIVARNINVPKNIIVLEFDKNYNIKNVIGDAEAFSNATDIAYRLENHNNILYAIVVI